MKPHNFLFRVTMINSSDIEGLAALSVAVAHCKYIAASMVVVAVLDVVLGQIINRGRWFMTHSLVNWVIVWFCVPDFTETMREPSKSMALHKSFSLAPVYLMMALHLYHVVAPHYSSNLSRQDVIHHVGFAFSLGLLQLSWHWGPNSNFFLMFVCGVPGAIDYALLSLVKQGRLDRMLEKRCNTLINTWLRGPGCCVSAWNIYACQIATTAPRHIPVLATAAAALLCFVNGQYYSERVVTSFARCSAEQALRMEYETDHPHPLVGSLKSPRNASTEGKPEQKKAQ